MSISHHLDEATVVAFATGQLSAPLSLVASMHIAMCPICHQRVQSAEALGGALLETQSPDPAVAFDIDSAWAAMEQRIARNAEPQPDTVKDGAPSGTALIRHWQESQFTDLNWQRIGKQVSQVSLPDFSSSQAWVKLFRFEPGYALPVHTHKAQEMSLVLQGAYRDEVGTFAVGDVSDLDADVHHQPTVIGDQPCIALIASEGHVHFRNPLLRLGARWFGL